MAMSFNASMLASGNSKSSGNFGLTSTQNSDQGEQTTSLLSAGSGDTFSFSGAETAGSIAFGGVETAGSIAMGVETAGTIAMGGAETAGVVAASFDFGGGGGDCGGFSGGGDSGFVCQNPSEFVIDFFKTRKAKTCLRVL